MHFTNEFFCILLDLTLNAFVEFLLEGVLFLSNEQRQNNLATLKIELQILKSFFCIENNCSVYHLINSLYLQKRISLYLQLC